MLLSWLYNNNPSGVQPHFVRSPGLEGIEYHAFWFGFIDRKFDCSAIVTQCVKFSLHLIVFFLQSVRLWKGTGLTVSGLVSGTRQSCSLTGTVIVRSSTHFFFPSLIGFLLLFVWVIVFPMSSWIGLGPAPLNMMQKMTNPRTVPWPAPEFRGIFLDYFPCQRITNWRPDK